jgi:putative transcriptional regulator
MDEELFEQLKGALKDARKYEEGDKLDLRVTELPPPPYMLSARQIVQIREKMSVSQTVFAHLLNVSPATVRAWEQGRRKPNQAALKLLHIARERPDALLAT